MTALARFGGVLLHPRKVLAEALDDPGRTVGVAIFVALGVAVLAQPLQTATAVLLATESLLGGLSMLVRVLGSGVLWELLLVSLFASAVHALVARGESAPSAEGVQAAALLTLVPFLALILVGSLLRRLDVSGALATLARYLPPTSWRGLFGSRTTGADALRLAIAYLPTLVLLGWLTVQVRRRSRM